MSDQSLPPNEETTGIDTYTKWVWKKWLVVLSSGGIAFVLLIWGLVGFTVTSLPILISIYSLFFIIQVYIATYQLWEAERSDKLLIIETAKKNDSQLEKLSFEKESLDQEARQLRVVLLQREQDRKPNLVGSVKDIQIDYVQDNWGKTIMGIRIFLYLGISNTSTVPTTISDFELDVSNIDGGHFLSYAGRDTTKFGFQQRECMISSNLLAKNNQWLSRRLLNGRKAELGERHEGWLFFDFEMIQNIDEKFDWSNNIVLKVIDAFDEKHQINGGLLKKYGED